MDSAHQTAERLHTLTLQDLMWVNLVATKKVNSFDYERLEQSAFRQFGYGGRQDVVAQAAGLLDAILRLRPFGEGNHETSLIACVAFLSLNGIALDASSEQALELVRAAESDGATLVEALRSLTQPDALWEPTLEPDLRGIVIDAAGRYGKDRAA